MRPRVSPAYPASPCMRNGRAPLDDLRAALDDLLRFGFGIVPALLVILAASVVARLLRQRARRALRRIDRFDRIRVAPNTLTLLENAITILVFFLAGLVVLGIFGLRSSSLVTFLGLLTAAVTLSLQDILRNLVAGVFLLLEQPFAIGDRIKVGGDEGVVERVGIRTTVIRNARAEPVLVPNIALFTQAVTNRSGRRPDAVRPEALVFRLTGVDLPPDEAVAAVRETVTALPDIVLAASEIEVEVAGSGGLELSLTLPLLPGAPAAVTPVIAALRDRFPEATISRVREG